MNEIETVNLPDMSRKTITFIGGGNMAASLIGGLVADGYAAERICVSDPDKEKLANLAARFGIRSAANNHKAVALADVVVLAVKPQALKAVAKALSSVMQQRRPLVISIAAGVREQHLQEWLGGGFH